jgi:DNA polymerase-2
MDRGFILDATYRLESGRPVVHLFGVTEEGASFVARDTRARPSFFLATEDLPHAEPILQQFRASAGDDFPHLGDREWFTLEGAPAREVWVAIPSDVPPLRDALRADGINCHEADIPFVTRYLVDRGVRAALRLEGPWRAGRRVQRIYEDAEIQPDAIEPPLRVLSLDIETDSNGVQVWAFALFGRFPHGGRVAETHAVRPGGRSVAPDSIQTAFGEAPCYYHPEEGALLHALRRRVAEIDPDVLTGWNVVGFDLLVLEAAFRRHAIPFFLGRADLPCRIRPAREPWATSRATVPGRAVLDGLDLLRGAFVRLDDYSLETAARTLLGEGKVFTAEDHAEEIARRYREDLPSFLLYNLTDARLVIEILEKLDLIGLAARRSRLTGLPIDRVGASIAAFDFLYIAELHRRGIVAPSVAREEPGRAGRVSDGADGDALAGEAEDAPIGGYVLDSRPGIHENVWVFDYRSLYPSIILTFNIDPLGHARAKREASASWVQAPNGAVFPRGEGILPGILRRLFPEREEARRKGDRVASLAIKILMNSFYGVLATPRCRFHSTAVSNAITTFGHTVLLWTKERLEAMGYPVIYGDTDSVFALSGIADGRAAQERGAEVAVELNTALTRWVREQYDLESHLQLEFERLFLKFFMPRLRHTREGSKKRYAGLVETPAGRRLSVTGLELVRRDWTVLAKDFQRHLLEKVLEGEAVEGFIAEFVAELRAGKRDGDLVYRKALRKPLEDYGRTTPPHVKAARLMQGRHGRVISYVMTTDGPQPVGMTTAPLDCEHYVEKQLAPIADAILVHIGLRFDEIAGKGGQIGLL